MERSIYVRRRHGRQNGGGAETRDAGTPIAIYEDVGLEEVSTRSKAPLKDGTHNLEISMDDTNAVHILQTKSYFQ